MHQISGPEPNTQPIQGLEWGQGDFMSTCKYFNTDEILGEFWSLYGEEAVYEALSDSVDSSSDEEGSLKSGNQPSLQNAQNGFYTDKTVVSSPDFPKRVLTPGFKSFQPILVKNGKSADQGSVADEFVSKEQVRSGVRQMRVGRQFKNRFRGLSNSD